MCAIFGMAGPPGHADPETLAERGDRMQHRGPDGAGLYINEDRSVGLAHRRLAILDLSERGGQPMSSAAGTLWIVFNGEIYNFRSLRREIEKSGRTFRSGTDTEVVLAAYEQWGLASLRSLRGMFAFALWDARLRRLWLVRDRLGIKPLFYRTGNATLWFASELKALCSDADSIDETAVSDFLTYGYVPAPKTIYRQIRKLEPGHYALFENGKLSMNRYWDAEPRPAIYPSAEDAAREVRSKIADAVEQHLAADVPVGIMLSGGVDSSSVAVLARRPLTAFSIGFDVPSHTETPYARLVASGIQSEYHEQTVTREMALGARDRVLSLFDEPFGDASAIPTYFVSQLARRRVKAALSGEGGDEVFGGYNWYRRWLRFEDPHRLLPPPAVARVAARVWPDGWRGSWTLRARALDPLERYAHVLGAFSRREKQDLLHPDLLRRLNGYDDLWHFRRYWRDDLDPLTRLQYLDLKTYLPDDVLTKLDRTTMSVGLEGRVPLLDHELVELVLSMPVERRNPNGSQKFLLKRAVSGLVPAAVLERPKKGFSPPLDAWLPTPHALGGGLDFDGLLRPARRLPEKARHGHGLWRVWVLAQWLRQHA